VTLGAASGLIVPLIAVHLFVFYFGILADDTPPVGLAAFAAAAIAQSDPIRTGIQGFTYDIRTAILPFLFIFNTELLLIGIESWYQLVTVVVSAVVAMLSVLAVLAAVGALVVLKLNGEEETTAEETEGPEQTAPDGQSPEGGQQPGGEPTVAANNPSPPDPNPAPGPPADPAPSPEPGPAPEPVPTPPAVADVPAPQPTPPEPQPAPAPERAPPRPGRPRHRWGAAR